MNQLHRLFSLSLVSVALVSASPKGFAAPKNKAKPGYSPVAEIEFDSTIPLEQYQLLARDLQDLQKFEFSNPDSQLLSVMDLSDASSRSMLNWLKARVHYVVGESFDPQKQARAGWKYSNFPYANELPDFEIGKAITKTKTKTNTNANANDSGSNPEQSPKPKPVVVMSNMGSFLYLVSKTSQALFSFEIPGAGNAMVTSPRVGIIQIGEGLFPKMDGAPNKNEAPQPKWPFAYRMATFFHEARHSDGHGKSLTFAHAVCPPEHDYAGTNACDRNLNGPYTVGAHFMNSMARSCKDCSTSEVERMRMDALDSISRVLPVTVSQAPSDPKGEVAAQLRGLTQLDYACRSIDDLQLVGSNGVDFCSSLDKVNATISQVAAAHPDMVLKKSTAWDPTPEQVQ